MIVEGSLMAAAERANVAEKATGGSKRKRASYASAEPFQSPPQTGK